MFLFLACSLAHDDTATYVEEAEAPEISSAKVSCDVDDAEWQVDVATENWTGGGRLWLSTDGEYIEDHGIDSVEAEGDGSADRLELDLDIVADWTEASGGSSTVFNCGTPGLAGFLAIFARDGDTVADCRAFGEEPGRWNQWGVGECATTVEISAG
ncbi:MAG: hypothetical protein FJ102_06160 [Deltaproteobacteria bacterium]|nr:hypothetical protein [Deltaproteobacteria bacterium]